MHIINGKKWLALALCIAYAAESNTWPSLATIYSNIKKMQTGTLMVGVGIAASAVCATLAWHYYNVKAAAKRLNKKKITENIAWQIREVEECEALEKDAIEEAQRKREADARNQQREEERKKRVSELIKKYEQEGEQETDYFPFDSDIDMRIAFRKLDQKQPNWKTATVLEIKHAHRDYMIFVQRLFRTIVKNHIKSNEPYTRSLGIKVAPNGRLTMELLPIDGDTDMLQHLFLFLLHIHPTINKAGGYEASVLHELTEIFKKRANPSKSTVPLFPKINVLPDNAPESKPNAYAFYRAAQNTIFIEEKYFKLEYLDTLLHEFAHCLQWRYCTEMGGIAYRPLSTNYDEYPNYIACELDAEQQSVYNHPDPESLADLLKTEAKSQIDENSETSPYLPYWTNAYKWAKTIEHFNFDLSREKELLRINIKKNWEDGLVKAAASIKDNPINTLYKNYIELYLKDCECRVLANEKTSLLLQDLTDIPEDIKSSIAKYTAGSPKFFKLKKELDFFPK